MASDIPHDAGFAANPDASASVGEAELAYRLLQFAPLLSERYAMMQPGRCKSRRRFQVQLFHPVRHLCEDIGEAGRGERLK